LSKEKTERIISSKKSGGRRVGDSDKGKKKTDVSNLGKGG